MSSLSPDSGNTARHSAQRRSLTSYPVERLRPSSPFTRAVSPARSFDLSNNKHDYMEQPRDIPRKPVGSPRSFNIGSIRTFRSKSESAVLPCPPTPALAPIPTRVSAPEEDKRATKGTPLVRSGSITKSKGKKNRHTKKPSFKKMDKDSSRWTFTDNITDLLTGKMFKKIEVDEMVTPEQVNDYKRRREQRAASQQEGESAEATEAIPSIKLEDPESPNEPFHLEDLAKRIGASTAVAGPRRDLLFQQELTHDVVRRDFSVRRNTTPAEDGVSPLTPDASSSPAPNLPAKNPARYINTDTQSQMPTIPELLVTTPENETDDEGVKLPIHGNTPTTDSLDDPFEDEDFVFFKSNPCTFTMPGIRHGPIRIAKAGLDLKFDTENTLDWTAFQMAIMGGAGDFFYGSPDLTPQYSEEEEIADLKEWLGELGFSRIGELVPAQPGDRPEGSDESSSSTSPISASSSCYDDDEEGDEEDYTTLPIPVALDYPTGFWNEGKPDTSKFSTGGGCQIKRWTIEGHPRKYRRSSCESETSLSRDGRPAELDAGNNADVVPMGSNLVHDLGDFLRWEAEFCSAGDF